MSNYPMKFASHSWGPSGTQSPWQTEAKTFDHQIPVAIPPEFEGPGNGLSPEDLYAMALQNCFIATFKVFAEKSKLDYESISVEAVLEVDKNDKGLLWMARIFLQVDLKGAVQTDRARRLLEKTSQSCMILNSVQTEKIFHFNLT